MPKFRRPTRVVVIIYPYNDLEEQVCVVAYGYPKPVITQIDPLRLANVPVPKIDEKLLESWRGNIDVLPRRMIRYEPFRKVGNAFRIERLIDILSLMKRAANDHGAELKAVIAGAEVHFTDLKKRKMRDARFQDIKRRSEAAGIPALNLVDFMEAESAAAEFLPDHAHWNAAGARKYAEIIAKFL
ncbi:MAG: hypothetical protein M5R36_08730 [Deltaproteobacteria bacterium]|nr:hypothetical protein [Deltaproteobacteria bacterium]